MHTHVCLIYLVLIADLTSAKGPHMTKSVFIVPQDQFSQCKILAQHLSVILHTNEYTLANGMRYNLN